MSKITSSGSDQFQLLLDRQMKAYGSPGNIGRILLEVKGDFLPLLLEDNLNSQIAKEIYQLRYRYRWLREGSYWVNEQHGGSCNLARHEIKQEKLLDHLPMSEFDLQKSKLYKLYWISHKNKQYIMLAWHHLLFDARGAEHFIKFLAGVIDEIDPAECFPTFQKIAVKDAMLGARDFKAYLMREKGLPIDTLIRTPMANPPVLRYKTILFSETDTQAIHEHASSLIRLMKSPFYLACCATVVRSIMEKRNIDFTSLLMPVPQDQRKRGSIKPLVGNSISYLFFRLKKEEFDSLEAIVKNLSAQMMEQVKIKLPAKYAGMMHVFKRTPLSFYNYLTKGPTKGKFASFFFSDTGVSTVDKVDDNPIEILDMIHLPPPNTFPGLTIVFSQFLKQIKITVCHTEDTLTTEEFDYFQDKIKELLIGNF